MDEDKDEGLASWAPLAILATCLGTPTCTLPQNHGQFVVIWSWSLACCYGAPAGWEGGPASRQCWVGPVALHQLELEDTKIHILPLSGITKLCAKL